MPTLVRPRDIFISQVLTGLVELRADESVLYDIDDIAPIVQVDSTLVELNIRTGSYGKIGQFRAENAQTPISQPTKFVAESVTMEIPVLSQKQIVREDRLRRLRSVDDGIARQAMDQIVNQAVTLREEDIRLSKLMVFRAMQDILTISYPTTGASVEIDYGMENADGGMSASHLPDVSGSTPFSNPAIDLQAIFDAWALLIADDAGVGQIDLTCITSTNVWRNMQKNTGLMAYAGGGGAPTRPTLEQAADYLGIREIILYDQPYKDLAFATQKYLPINKVILKADAISNVPVVQLLDGPVVRVVDDELVTEPNPGAVAEMWVGKDPPVQNIRVSTAKIPLVVRNGIVAARVL